jgi:hypothetical protein
VFAGVLLINFLLEGVGRWTYICYIISSKQYLGNWLPVVSEQTVPETYQSTLANCC